RVRARGGNQVERRAVLAFEPLGRRRPLREITAWGEETARDRPEFEPLFAEQDKNALRGCSEGHKFKLQAARHGAISSRMCTNSAPGKVEAGFADAIKRAPRGQKSGRPAWKEGNGPVFRPRRPGRSSLSEVSGRRISTDSRTGFPEPSVAAGTQPPD